MTKNQQLARAETRGFVSGFVSSFRQKVKCLFLALSQVPKGVMRNSEQKFLFKSYARRWFFSVRCFSAHKIVRDFRKQKVGEISYPALLSGKTRLRESLTLLALYPFLLNINKYHSLLNNSEVTINLLSEENQGLRNNLVRILLGVTSAK